MPRTALRMPKMSMTMEEGELVGWRVAVGDRVTEGQVVCEVLTDKVDMEVEAPADGTVVGIDVGEGQSVPVGTPIAWIDTESDSLMDDLFATPSPGTGAPRPASGSAPAGTPVVPPADAANGDPGSPAASNGTGIVPAIPGARRLAAAADLDLHGVRGTGPTGAIMVSDVRAALAQAAAVPTAAPAPAAAAPAPAPAAPAPAAPAPAAPAPPTAPAPATLAATVDDDRLRLQAAALAPRPGEAMSAPGACLWRDAVLGYRPAPPDAELLARVAAAVGAGLAEVGPPGVRDLPRVGLLVATPAGSVPVTLVAPHRQPFDVLVADVGSALDQARSGSVDVRFLAPPDATVTWLDQVDRVTVPVRAGALVAIGMGSAARRVVAVGDGIAVRTTVTLSATADSRLADPAGVATLLARIVAALEAA
jgi:pyruvate dehydrogenase E2 component (dihydrolipoamide acetyltransferase)